MEFTPQTTTSAVGVAVMILLKTVVAVSALSTAATSSRKSIGNEQVPGLKNGMDYTQLGDSDLIVSRVCMGTVRKSKSSLE
jgi:hypothetical protein